MPNFNDANKRDFVDHMILFLTDNAAKLTEKGYDPATKTTSLQASSTTARQAEVKQHDAQAAAISATKVAQDSLDAAYKEASATVELLAGLLGKNDPQVLELRKMRK